MAAKRKAAKTNSTRTYLGLWALWVPEQASRGRKPFPLPRLPLMHKSNYILSDIVGYMAANRIAAKTKSTSTLLAFLGFVTWAGIQGKNTSPPSATEVQT
jgi:hypothetical protein